MEIWLRTGENGETGEDEDEKKSVFVKIPLTGEAGKNFKQVISLKAFEYICFHICTYISSCSCILNVGK